MTNDYMLDGVLDKIKMVSGIEKNDNSKILIDNIDYKLVNEI